MIRVSFQEGIFRGSSRGEHFAMTTEAMRLECHVLVRGLGTGLLRDVVTDALSRMTGVVIHQDDTVAEDDVDLVVERGVEGQQVGPATVSVTEAGRCVIRLPVEQLTHSTLALVVNAVRQEEHGWLGDVLVACRRIDAVIEHATEVASATYAGGGGFEDWRARFADGARIAGDRAEEAPLSSRFASRSSDPRGLLASLDAKAGDDAASRAGTRPPAGTVRMHPFSALVREFDLSGREVDLVLLCFVGELDSRYGRRFAYIQQDVAATAPTVDLVATLLCDTAAERLELHRTLWSGPLVTTGIVRVDQRTGQRPSGSAPLGLDPAVLRMLIGDRAPDAGQDFVDPHATPRLDPSFQVGPVAQEVAALLDAGEPVHLAGADPATRRAVATDVAHLLGHGLVVVPYGRLLASADDDGPDRAAAEALRRELLRLDSIGLVDDVPAERDGWQAVLGFLGARVLTGCSAALPTLATDRTRRRRLVPVTRPRGGEREAAWVAAAEWVGVTVIGGLDPLVSRFGVSVDEAAAALESASHDERRRVQVADVLEVLTMRDIRSAGGLLTTVRPRAHLHDLVLDPVTRRELDYACARIRHRDDVIIDQGWDQRSSRLTGTYLLFAGPSGTGKTMAAEAVAAELGLPIQYLELSSLLSRWVGEFEKSVDAVFAAAEATGGIIVINEADALLAPRTEVDNAQARYANAGTSHLLSRLEQFTGHVIFTSNLLGADSIDPAFHRRLTATIRFRRPDPAQRLALWRAVWPEKTSAGAAVRYVVEGEPVGSSTWLERLADDHPLSGGSIANIARNAAFLATQRREATVRPVSHEVLEVDIDAASLEEALRLELGKIGDFRVLMRGRAAS